MYARLRYEEISGMIANFVPTDITHNYSYPVEIPSNSLLLTDVPSHPEAPPVTGLVYTNISFLMGAAVHPCVNSTITRYISSVTMLLTFDLSGHLMITCMSKPSRDLYTTLIIVQGWFNGGGWMNTQLSAFVGATLWVGYTLL